MEPRECPALVGDPAATDRRLRIHRARERKVLNGPDHFIAILHALGVPAPAFMGWTTILVELVGGLAVLAGAFVPLVSIPMAAIMFTAALTVHLPHGFSSIKLRAVTAAGAEFGPPGYEVPLLYLACLATLVLNGPGPFAVDGLLARHLRMTRQIKNERGLLRLFIRRA